jgi:feruloyl esterase
MLGVDMGRAAAAVDSIGGAFTTSAWQDVSARSPDLAGFFARNGKLIVAQGVSDPVFSIEDTIVWYKLVMAQGGPTATAAMRLFALPGMNHCSGGPATDQFDGFGALVAWVEHGKAPERITAHASPMSPWSKRSRPLCAYPRIARYRGAGDEDDAENFVCT